MTDFLYLYNIVHTRHIGNIRNLYIYVTKIFYINVFFNIKCLLVLCEYVLFGIKKICELLVDLKVVRTVSVKGYRRIFAASLVLV